MSSIDLDIALCADSTSSTLPSSDALLAIIASLRSELVHTQSQLHHAQHDSNSTQSRPRRTSIPVSANSTGLARGSSSNGHVVRPSSRAASARGSYRGQDSPSNGTGYTGAPPSSLATPSAPYQSTPPAFTLRRDKSYDDLNSVMNMPTPSPTLRNGRKTSFTQSQAGGLGVSLPRRRSNSIDAGSSSSSGGGNTSTSSRIPMPVIAKGSVGTAMTLAGGGSPKSPHSRDENVENEGASFKGPAPRSTNGILQDSASPSNLYANNWQEDELATSSLSTSLPLPSPHPLSPSLRSPRYSTESEVSAESPEMEARAPKSSVPIRAGSSPFFGGSAGFTEKHAARIASSQSGTSKVIMTLQTELTNARAQLDSTKSQLRASARAVESLTRQIEDVREGKERQRIELQSLTTTLTRRDRMLEETLARARHAESQLKTLEDEKKVHYSECARRTKDLEGRCKEAEERKAKAESEYSALRGATNSLSEGWKKEVKALRKESAALKLAGERDCNDAKTRQAAVTKLVSGRTSSTEAVEQALADLSIWQDALLKQYEGTISALSRQNERSEKENEVMLQRTQQVRDDLASYQHAMRTFDERNT